MVSAKRIFLIVMIFVGTTLAWMILGGVMSSRTGSQYSSLGSDIRVLWGQQQVQTAPQFIFEWQTPNDIVSTEQRDDGRSVTIKKREMVTAQKMVPVEKSGIQASIDLDQRLRGLMWYALFGVTFDGQWVYKNDEPIPGILRVQFRLPVPGGVYDDFRFIVDDENIADTLQPDNGVVSTTVAVQPGQIVSLNVHYKARGIDEWSYLASSEGVANLRDFSLAITTDFSEIDFPEQGMSPSKRQTVAQGWRLHWDFAQVLTGQRMGVLMPKHIQPGELAAALSFSAPISLFFFFVLLFVFSVLQRIDVHPINYMFIAAAFFAFHLLFSYSVDHLQLIPAFVVASVSSIVLVTSYLRLVVSNRFAFFEAALMQLFYQIGFSLAHFWQGYTGLTVTVLSTLTLFVLMQLTGRLRWSVILDDKHTAAAASQRA